MRVHVHLIIDNSMLYSFLLLQSQLLTTNLFKPPPCEDSRITATTIDSNNLPPCDPISTPPSAPPDVHPLCHQNVFIETLH